MSVSKFVAPKFDVILKRMVELEFSALVGAGLYATVVAGPIMYPFHITQVNMTFDQLSNYNMEYRWFISSNSNAPTTMLPSDENIFGRESPTAFFIGNGILRQKDCDIKVDTSRTYIKFSMYNKNTYACYGLGSMAIQEL